MRLFAKYRHALAPAAIGGLAALLIATLATPASAKAVTGEIERAQAAANPSEVAFQANTNFLYTYTPAGNKSVNSHLGMRADSSPSIAGGVIAFVANTRILWVYQPVSNARIDSGLRVYAGSPAIATSGDKFAVAFEGGGHNLWIYYYVPGKGWAHYNTGLHMMPGTSPALVGSPGGGWEVAYQGLDRRLYAYGYKAGHPGSVIRTGKFMDPASSPAITVLSGGRFQVAYQYYTHRLAVYTTKAGNFLTGLGMDPGTSPSIAAGTEVAFQDDTNHLWLYHPAGNTNRDTHLGMTPGTSPAITAIPGAYEIAFQADTGILWVYDTRTGAKPSGLGMWIASSPAVAG